MIDVLTAEMYLEARINCLITAMKEDCLAAYQDGAAGKPCGIWPDLTAETGPEEIQRKADEISRIQGGKFRDSKLFKIFVAEYLKAWQDGARSSSPTPPEGVPAES